MTQTSVPTETRPRPGLVRSLGLFTAIMLVIGGVIGSGIFRKPGVMAAQVGSPTLLLAIWFLAGGITLFGALTNAEIAAMIPETGGQYVYFERMYGPFVAFLYGWAVFAIIQTGSIAAVAYVFAEYATEFIRLPEFPRALAAWSFHLPWIGNIAPLDQVGVKGLAATLIILLTMINFLGVKFGGLLQDVFTVAKLVAMLALVAGAFLLPTGGSFSNLTSAGTGMPATGWALLAACAGALQGAFWAYDGWNKITYVAGEIKDPQRSIPRALLFGLLAVTAVYVLITVAYAYVLPIDVMAKSKLVAADVADRCFPGGARWMSAAVLISTFGITNAMVLATARVFFAMAQRRVFPSILGAVHPRFHTPGPALLVQCTWSVLLLFSGTFDTLTDSLIFVSWVFYALGAAGLFVLRRKEPNAPRPYRVPGYPVVPCVFILVAVSYLVLTVVNDLNAYRAALAAGRPGLINSAFGTALVLVGTPIYFYYRRTAADRTGRPLAET